MKNQKISTPEGDVWNSRSVSTEGYVLTTDDNGDYYILVCKRGKGGSHPGLWNVPSGYLDWGETIDQCCLREIFEETGIDITKEYYSKKLYSIDSGKRVYRQNVVFKYIIQVLGLPEEYNITDEYSEENEVEECKWLKLVDYKTVDWAFNQKDVVESLYMKYYG